MEINFFLIISTFFLTSSIGDSLVWTEENFEPLKNFEKEKNLKILRVILSFRVSKQDFLFSFFVLIINSILIGKLELLKCPTLASSGQLARQLTYKFGE